METLWIKITIIVLIKIFVYREIIKSTRNTVNTPTNHSKANFAHLLIIGVVVGAFTYIGMSITWIDTRDLRLYLPPTSPQMVIKTNLAKEGFFKSLADKLVQGYNYYNGYEA